MTNRNHLLAAGLLYLAIIVFGLFAEIGVRSTLIVGADPSATADNIASFPWLFRLGFASDAIMTLADAALAVLLYLLFRPVSKPLALIAAATRLAQAAVLAFNLLNYYLAVLVLDGGGAMAAFSSGQRESLASLFLSAHAHGYDIGLLFFGLHCVILGHLLAASRLAPRVLGSLVKATGLIYLAGSFTRFVWPEQLGLVSPLYLVAVVSELWLCGWLLAKGYRRPTVPAYQP